MSGVICDRRVPARVKGKVYKVAVRPAMLYGLETVALTKRQEAEMEVAELKMLRFSLGVTRMDKIRKEYIRGTAQVGKFGEKTREARLRWYGHLRKKDDGYIGRRMLRMELPGKRKRGRPKRRFMDVVKEDMGEVEVTEEDTVDRTKLEKENPLWQPLMGKAERRRRRLISKILPAICIDVICNSKTIDNTLTTNDDTHVCKDALRRVYLSRFYVKHDFQMRISMVLFDIEYGLVANFEGIA